MTTQTSTLAEFLLRAIAEDEAVAEAAGSFTPWSDDFQHDNYGHLTIQPARVLAQCKAHRAIVEYATDQHTGGIEFDEILRALASIYADRDGFDPRWTL